MNRSLSPSFPSFIPRVDWQTGLPKFQDKKGEGDDVSIHFISFHLHIHRLRIDFPEDCLMKMFMITLEENVGLWCETRPCSSISSIKDFYLAFCKRYKRDYPTLELIEDSYGNFESLKLCLGFEVVDEDLRNDEIKEAPLESNCQSSCPLDMSVSESYLQKEYVQEVVFLDTSEEQHYIEDQLVEEQEVVPFSLSDNKEELSHPPRYDEYDDDFLEQPILDTSSGSDPIYDDYASHS